MAFFALRRLRGAGCPDLEFKWSVPKELGAVEQSAVNERYVRAGIMSVNEVRATMGLAPVEGGDACRVYGAQATALAGAGSQNGNGAGASQNASSQNGNGVGSSQHATSDNGSQNASSGNGSQNAMQIAKTAEWNEDLHPRDKDGRFTFTGQGVNGSGVNGSGVNGSGVNGGATDHSNDMAMGGGHILPTKTAPTPQQAPVTQPEPPKPATPPTTQTEPPKTVAPTSVTPPNPPAGPVEPHIPGRPIPRPNVDATPPTQPSGPAPAQQPTATKPIDRVPPFGENRDGLLPPASQTAHPHGYGLSKDYTLETAIQNFDQNQTSGREPHIPDDIAGWIVQAARAYHVDPAMLAAMINGEAKHHPVDGHDEWDRNFIGSGAVGLGQFFAPAWQDVAIKCKDSLLHQTCVENGYLDKHGNILKSHLPDILALRMDPEISINSVAAYATLNLKRAEADGLLAQDASADEVTRVAYIMHHEGTKGGIQFLSETHVGPVGDKKNPPTAEQENTNEKHLIGNKGAHVAESMRLQYGGWTIAYHHFLEDHIRNKVTLGLFQATPPQ